MLFFDNFYAFNNGRYGLWTQGTNSGYSNFQIERNGTAGIHNIGANNRFISGEVIWNGSTDNSEAGVYIAGFRNIISAVATEDNYTNGFYDTGNDNSFIGCLSDSNGYVQQNVNASSLVASGFVIRGTGGVYLGDKVTSSRGILPDGNFTTEWPYTLVNTAQSRVDVTFDSVNKPPPTPAADPTMTNNIFMLPSTGTATSPSTNSSSVPLDLRGSFWNGTSAVSSDWQIQNLSQFGSLVFSPPSVGTNPGSPTVTFPQLATASSSSGNFGSVSFQMQSSVWNGSQPLFPGWEFQASVGAGTNPNSVFKLFPYNTTGIPTFQILSNVSLSQSLNWGGGVTINSSSEVPQVRIPAPGHAACILASGPPVTIGYCSTALSSSGTCVCN